MYLAPAECECFLLAVAEKGEGSRKLSDSGGSGEKGDGRGDHKLCIVSLGTPECLATTRRSKRRSSGGSRRRRSVAATGGCTQVPMMHEGPAEERARCPSSTAGMRRMLSFLVSHCGVSWAPREARHHRRWMDGHSWGPCYLAGVPTGGVTRVVWVVCSSCRRWRW